ncbi:hypothetical protein [Ectopseudomonas guguanensis]|jgi:hypothetical protein|uniref:hypothetical protein n=1 Tax=Ectopseudomonas guguanensis TaxID=1198456 RepID=UPI0028A96A6E|nr:hypothetical protein [Pseudomonas guguanensis]
MRAGRLDTPAELLELQQDLAVRCLDWMWFSINSKESADVPAHTGLRSPAKVAVRAWWDERLQPGRYLRSDVRLFLIDDVRDFTGQRAEVAITCSELVGQAGQYLPADGAPRCCRVHLTHEAPYRDELGQVTSYMTRAEVAIIEVGRPQEGDQLRVAGVPYVVANYADESDDGVVRGLWLLPVE